MKIRQTKLKNRSKQYGLVRLRLGVLIEAAIVLEVLSVYYKYYKYKRRVSTAIRY